MTQIRLSIELEVSQETVSSYESGKYYPSFPVLVKMATILNTSIDYMMGLSTVRHPQPSVLSSDADTLLQLFSTLNQSQQEKLLAYAQGISDR